MNTVFHHYLRAALVMLTMNSMFLIVSTVAAGSKTVSSCSEEAILVSKKDKKILLHFKEGEYFNIYCKCSGQKKCTAEDILFLDFSIDHRGILQPKIQSVDRFNDTKLKQYLIRVQIKKVYGKALYVPGGIKPSEKQTEIYGLEFYPRRNSEKRGDVIVSGKGYYYSGNYISFQNLEKFYRGIVIDCEALASAYCRAWFNIRNDIKVVALFQKGNLLQWKSIAEIISNNVKKSNPHW